MSPASRRQAPLKIFIRVDLPAPFSPTSTCTSPARRSKLTLSRATTPGKVLRMPLILNMGGSGIAGRHSLCGSGATGPPHLPHYRGVDPPVYRDRRVDGDRLDDRVHARRADRTPDLRAAHLHVGAGGNRHSLVADGIGAAAGAGARPGTGGGQGRSQ